MEVRPATAPSHTNKIRADIAEVWRGGSKIGLLYQVFINGANGAWSGDALKYRLDSAGGEEVELRFTLNAPGMVIHHVAAGHLVGDLVADGELHREGCALKGTRLEVA